MWHRLFIFIEAVFQLHHFHFISFLQAIQFALPFHHQIVNQPLLDAYIHLYIHTYSRI